MKEKILSLDSYIVAEVELVYKTKVKSDDRPQICCTTDAYNLLVSLCDKKLELQEQFKAIQLNKNYRVHGVYETCTGSTWQTIVDPKLIFAAALKAQCNYPRP